MSVSGAKSCAMASMAAAMVASSHARPVSAASVLEARFGVPAMPPKAMRAPVARPSATVTLKQPQTALMS